MVILSAPCTPPEVVILLSDSEDLEPPANAKVKVEVDVDREDTDSEDELSENTILSR